MLCDDSKVFHRVIIIIIVTKSTLSSGSTPKTYHYQLLEESPRGTVVGDIKRDSGLTNGKFVLITSDSISSGFTVNTDDGILKTASVIDRDVLCPRALTCSVTLDVAFQAPQVFQLIKAVVEINDINDNSPKFPILRLVEALTEGTGPGFKLPIQPADDPDSPENSIANYQLVSSSQIFELQLRRDGDGILEPTLELRDALDRERQTFYQLKIIAIDGGQPSKSGSVAIDIEVKDTNDNSPTFLSQFYEVDIEENLDAQKSLLTVKATDPDADQNGQVKYSFSDKTFVKYYSKFSIDSHTGVIGSLSQLDYEEESLVVLEVVAMDKGNGSLPSTAQVVIRIKDKNDNAPIIQLDIASEDETVNVSEQSLANTFVVHLKVTDADSAENGQVQCSLKHQHFLLLDFFDNEFQIVTSSQPLDRETLPEHKLYVNCSDLGVPSSWTVTSLVVIVDDINDNAPQFTHSSYNFTMLQNRYGAWIGRVLAVDLDEGANGEIIYFLEDDDIGRIHINNQTGVLISENSFNSNSHFKFNVLAIDKGSPPRISKTIVNVEILDDRAVSDSKTVFPVLENESPMTAGRLMKLHQIPLDWRIYSPQLEGLHSDHFELVNDTVQSRRALDRELIDLYHLRVIARRDTFPFLSSVTDVFINVSDVNDNWPVIQFPAVGNDIVQVPSNLDIGSIAAQVLASDADAGENARLAYKFTSIKGDTSEFFMDSETGMIIVNESLVDMVGRTLRLPLSVRDAGTPSRTSKSVLNIHITPPTFDKPSPASMPVKSKTSHSHMLITVIIASITLAIVIILLIIIIICKKRRHWSPDMSSDKSLSRKSDVTQETTTTLRSVNTSPEFSQDLCHCGALEDLGYLDIGCRTSLCHPSPMMTPSWKELGMDDTLKSKRLTDYNSLKRDFLLTTCDSQQRELFNDWLRSDATRPITNIETFSPVHRPAINGERISPAHRPISSGESFSPVTTASDSLTRRYLRYGDDVPAMATWRVGALGAKPLSPPPFGSANHSLLRSPHVVTSETAMPPYTRFNYLNTNLA